MFDDPVRRLCGEPRRGRGAGAAPAPISSRSARPSGATRVRVARRPSISAWRSRCDEMRAAARFCGARRACCGERGAQPLQISPPIARPPASIPAKPAQKPAAASSRRQAGASQGRQPREDPPSRRPPAASLKKSIEPESPAAAAKPPRRPRLRAERVRARPTPRPRRSPRRRSRSSPLRRQQDRAAAAAVRSPTGRRRVRRLSSAATISRPSRRHAPRQRAGRPGRHDLARRALCQRLRRARRTRRRRSPGSRSRPTAATGRRSSRSRCSRFAGRGGPQDQAEAAALLDKAAKLGHVAAAYNLALLYLEGQQVAPGHRARRRAVARRRRCRQPRGAIRARDALQGGQRRRRRIRPRPRSCSAPPRAAATSRPRSNTRSRCSTAPASRRTRAAPPRCSARPRYKGNAIAQNRLARILATGRGAAGRSGRRRRSGTPSPRPAARPTSGSRTSCRRSRTASARPARTRRGSGSRTRSRAARSYFAEHRRADCHGCAAASVARPRSFPCARIAASSARAPRGVTRARPIRPAQRHDRRRPQGRRAASSATSARSRTCRSRSRARRISSPPPIIAPRKSCAPNSLKARPGYGFLGEEGGSREGTDKTHTWIVDPLDGTTNFLHGIPHFAISIALRARRHDRRGADLQSGQRRVLHRRARQGRVPQRSAHPRRGAQAARRRGRVLRAAASRARRPRAVPPRDWRSIQDKVAGLRRFGAAALDLAWVAAGRFDCLLGAQPVAVGFRRRRADGARGRRLRHRPRRQRAHDGGRRHHRRQRVHAPARCWRC